MVDMNNLKVGPIKPMSEEEIKKLHFKFKESDFNIIEQAKQQIIEYCYTDPEQAEICNTILLGLDLIMFKIKLAINHQNYDTERKECNQPSD